MPPVPDCRERLRPRAGAALSGEPQDSAAVLAVNDLVPLAKHLHTPRRDRYPAGRALVVPNLGDGGIHPLPCERGPRRRRHLGPHLLLLRLDLRELRTKTAQVRLQSRRLGGSLPPRPPEPAGGPPYVCLG